ncbi:hypothetical protein ACFVVA_34685 [Kitasatospora sp. NPDC058048]|uniref:hypothetical protein n=1 Tax=Kitasatospora sp. NPDC058048 TaxID=3346313 RepID=UPI0036DF0FB4
MAMRRHTSRRPASGAAFCIHLPGNRTLGVPWILPTGVAVVVLVVLGYDVQAAIAAVLATGAVARELGQSS